MEARWRAKNGGWDGFFAVRLAAGVTLRGLVRRTIGIRAVPEFTWPFEVSERWGFPKESATHRYGFRGVAILEPLQLPKEPCPALPGAVK